jgi:radical SAM protein with 4Fe4S-binding SPASM domain
MSTVLAARRGRAPNCSASGFVVGASLLGAIAAAAVVNAFADRFARWRDERPPGPPARVRNETLAAWLALPGTAALLLLGPDGARAAADAGATRIGGGPAPEGAWTAPLEVHVARTSYCPVRCDTCYTGAGPDGVDADRAALEADLDALAARGVFEIAIGGGDRAPDDALFALARGIRDRGMVPNLTTAGFGVDRAAAERMAGLFGQVNVSVDGLGSAYARVRGWSGARIALAAVDALVAAGVRVGVNTVLTRATVDELERLGDALAARGVAEWQWLRLKPAGRGAAGYADHALTPDQALALWPRALAIEARTGLTLRWDCAMVPFLAAHDVPVEALTRLAVEGCPGGRSLLARDVEGRWAPCSFAGAGEAGPVEAVWERGATLGTWRRRAAAPPEPCGSCAYRAICRGGCRIVAGHLTGDPLAPDPECPRVRAAGLA